MSGTGCRICASAKTIYACCDNLGLVRAGSEADGSAPVDFKVWLEFIAGVIPLCLVPFILFTVPESIKFLTVAHQNTAAVASILRKINPCRQFADDSAIFLKMKHSRVEDTDLQLNLRWAACFCVSRSS